MVNVKHVTIWKITNYLEKDTNKKKTDCMVENTLSYVIYIMLAVRFVITHIAKMELLTIAHTIKHLFTANAVNKVTANGKCNKRFNALLKSLLDFEGSVVDESW